MWELSLIVPGNIFPSCKTGKHFFHKVSTFLLPGNIVFISSVLCKIIQRCNILHEPHDQMQSPLNRKISPSLLKRRTAILASHGKRAKMHRAITESALDQFDVCSLQLHKHMHRILVAHWHFHFSRYEGTAPQEQAEASTADFLARYNKLTSRTSNNCSIVLVNPSCCYRSVNVTLPSRNSKGVQSELKTNRFSNLLFFASFYSM